MARRLALEDPARHATPSDIRLGHEIVAAIEIVDTSATMVVARAGRGTPRMVSFSANADRLVWHCTCRRDQPPWCKHLVALALACRA